MLPLPGRCDNRPFAGTKGLALWQQQVPATPTDIGFASSATALPSFNDEIRMSNAFPYDESAGWSTSPALGYSPEANFFETPSAAFRLPSAAPPRASAVQDWDPGWHSLTRRYGAAKSKKIS